MLSKDGELFTEPTENKKRWQKHHAEVLNGEILNLAEMRELPRPECINSTKLKFGPVKTVQSFRALGRNKGCG